MVFWIVAVVLALLVAGLLALALLRGRAVDEPPAAYDLRVYRDQLKEIDRDLARGVIGADDAERTRTEISRRILTADAQLQAGGATGGQPAWAGRGLAILLAAVIVGGAAGLYAVIGEPGRADFPLRERIEAAQVKHNTRPSQSEFEAKLPVFLPNEPEGQYKELMDKLRATVANRPDDLNGQNLLARNEANLGNAKAAYTAQANVVRLKGAEATVEDHLFLAEMMINAAQGYISPEAESSLQKAMQKDPRNPVTRYYWGLMLIQNDRADLAFRLWEQLLTEGPADAPWIPPIRKSIEELAWIAGVKYELPAGMRAAPAQPGPTSEDMQAASEMSAADRQDMIRGMVGRLSERLADEGGTPQEWARLIGAYGVLGEADRAKETWAEAQKVFADKPADLSVVRAAAARAGLSE